MENSMSIKLDLTLEEVNIVLRTLGKHPFEEVAALVGKIRAQGEPQAIEQAKAAEAAKAAQAAPAVESEGGTAE